MSQIRRRVYLVDPQVQGALMFRVCMYWAYCLLTLTIMMIWWTIFTGPPQPFLQVVTEVYERFVPAAFASCLLLPLVLFDVLRLSNRFVGPIRRMRGALRELVEGENVSALSFRDNDYWRELAIDFNHISQRLRRLENEKLLDDSAATGQVELSQRESQPSDELPVLEGCPAISASTAARA